MSENKKNIRQLTVLPTNSRRTNCKETSHHNLGEARRFSPIDSATEPSASSECNAHSRDKAQKPISGSVPFRLSRLSSQRSTDEDFLDKNQALHPRRVRKAGIESGRLLMSAVGSLNSLDNPSSSTGCSSSTPQSSSSSSSSSVIQKRDNYSRDTPTIITTTAAIAPLSQVLLDTSSLLNRRRYRNGLTGASSSNPKPRGLANLWSLSEATSPAATNSNTTDDVFAPSTSENGRSNVTKQPDDLSLSIPERIYLRAVRDLNSKDLKIVKHAQLMLHRLTESGFKTRPKAMSSPSKPLSVPTVKVTIHHEDRPSSATESSLTSQNVRYLHRAAGGLSDLKIFHRRLSMSDSNLSVTDCHSIPTRFMFDIDTMRRRKDSVSWIRKRSSISGVTQRRRRSSASITSQHLSTEGRRSSMCGAIWSGKQEPPHSPDDISIASWSSLMSCIPEEERKDSYISRHHVYIAVPVCQIGKEKPLTFTSLEVIERTIRRLYPELIVKKKLSNETQTDDCFDEKGSVDSFATLKSVSPSGQKKKILPHSQNMDRRSSINSCISNMRVNKNDYDKQLTGVKNMGTFAEEETLKVLFAKSDAISCVIEAMKAFPEKEELQLNACLSLLKMASSSEANCVHILANDGINAITTILRKHQDNAQIVRLLFSTIAFISTGLDPATSLVNGGLHSLVLSAMSRHGSDKHIVRECCFIIGNLLSSVEAAQQLMFVGGVHTIISLAKQFPDDATILENVCRTLGSFAIYDETCLDVARAGATSTVLAALESRFANASVIECGCWAMASLTACVQTCEELVKLDGVKTTLRVLTEYPKEQSLQDYGVRVLCNLSDYDQTLPAICTVEVVTILHDVLNQFQDSVELLEIITTTLCHILVGDDRLCEFVVEQKFLKDLLHVMMDYSDNCAIQENGCKIIGNVAVQDFSRKQAEMYGASKAVISAMLTNETNAEVHEVGCLALMNLTADNNDNKVRIKNAGAVPTLLGTLREFSYDPNIVLCALKALGNLVSLEEVCHLLLDEKGLDTIISLTKSHSQNEEILVFVTMILCGVTELQDLKEEETRQVDQTLVDILSSTQNNADITLYVCQATENLIRTDAGRQTFMNCNRLGVILSAINSFPNIPEIHRTCCKVIAGVAFYMDSKRRLITETTVKSVMKSMELFPLEADIQIVGCGTIACILEKIAILKHEVIGQGGIDVIHDAINNHCTESRLAVVALMALSNMLPIDASTYRDESRTAYDIVIQCMNNFGENKEIQVAGTCALARFNLSDKHDVKTMASTLLNSIRRHGEEPEIQRNAAIALRSSYKKEAFSDALSQVLKSPSIKVSEIFWTEIDKPPQH